MTKKQKILSIILVTVLIVSVTAVTYAFFAINIVNDSSPITVITTEVANLRMTSMNSPVNDPLYPGWVGYHAIDVSATGSGSVAYDLSLSISGGTNVKSEVEVQICKVINSSTALSQSDIDFTAATPMFKKGIATASDPNNKYYMISGEVVLPTCYTVFSSTLSDLGSSYLISGYGGKTIAAGKHDKYYVKLEYVNKSSSQVQGEAFVITPTLVPRSSVYETNVIANGTAVNVLKSKANPLSNTDYSTSSSAEKAEMYTFGHNATDQTPAQIDYRYIGSSPNNYAYFNCDDYYDDEELDISTCETWRILGVFPVDNGYGSYTDMIKIIREEAVDYSTMYCEYDCADWTESPVAEYLNGEYISELSYNAQYSISGAKWYLGAPKAIYEYFDESLGTSDYITDGRYYNSAMLYYQERGNIISQGASYTNDYLPIGLIYPSDYIFTFAYNVSMISDKGGDYQSAYSWLTNLNVDFTISRNVDSLLIYGIFNPYVDPALDIISVFSYGDIHPVVYLNANVILNPDIETQDGSISHPYVFLSTD